MTVDFNNVHNRHAELSLLYLILWVTMLTNYPMPKVALSQAESHAGMYPPSAQLGLVKRGQLVILSSKVELVPEMG